MEISIDVVKALREKTGLSVMQCKKALEETDGDIDKAEGVLRKRSSEAADKKSDREIGAGAVGMYLHDNAIGSMVLISCETDFVSKNPEFEQLARELAMQVAATNPSYLSEDDIVAEEKEAAFAVFKEEVKDKPADMQEKILAGKMDSYFRDFVLLNQSYIKEESKTIKQLVDEASQKFGERVEISKFARFSARG